MNVATSHGIFEVDPTLEDLDPVEREMLNAYMEIVPVLDKDERQSHEELQRGDPRRICDGLLYGIVGFPGSEQAKQLFRLLRLVIRDYAHCVTQLNGICLSYKFARLYAHARMQIMWVLDSFAEFHVPGTDALYISLLRQLRGGDLSSENLEMIEMCLDSVERRRKWVNECPNSKLLVSHLVFTFARLLRDHKDEGLASLRQRETNLVASILKTRFSDCMDIGRDFVRILQEIANIPEITSIWRDLMASPKRLSPRLQGLTDILSMPTNHIFLASRVTPDMEKKLIHILRHVDSKNFRRNYSWFEARFLNTNESETLVSDLVRFVSGCFHPDNALLSSSITKRFQIMAMLMARPKSPVALAQARLALFYDTFCFNSTVDNIMNLEPSWYLLGDYLDRVKSDSAGTLIEFLYVFTQEFCPPITPFFMANIQQAIKMMVDLRVLISFRSFAEHPNLDEQSRYLLGLVCPQLRSTNADSNGQGSAAASQILVKHPAADLDSLITELHILVSKAKNEDGAKRIWIQILRYYDLLESNVIALKKLGNIFSTIFDLEGEDYGNVVSKDIALHKNAFWNGFVDFMVEQLQIHQVSDGRSSQDYAKRIVELMGQLVQDDSKVGVRQFSTCLLIYALQQAAALSERKFLESYQALAPFTASTQVFKDVVLLDLKLVYNANLDLFYNIVPKAFKYLPSECVGNTSLCTLVALMLTPELTLRFSCSLRQMEFTMFGNFPSTLIAQSLEWDIYEQGALWKLLAAEIAGCETSPEIDPSDLISMVKLVQCDTLRTSPYPEAAQGLVQCILNMKPASAVITTLFDGDFDMVWTALVLRAWMEMNGQQVTEEILAAVGEIEKRAKIQGDDDILKKKEKWIEGLKTVLSRPS
ncbi:protein-domain-containing protein [Cladochytrium replicatum]|nr:protein-domain-containing protein [Cladochytrium replicatum]